MRENRRTERVNFLSAGWLHYNETRYACLLENISTSGVLLRVKKTINAPILPGEACKLLLAHENDDEQYHQVDARVVRFDANMAALEFTGLKNDSRNIIDTLIQKELCFIQGSQKLIDLGKEVAAAKGFGLTTAYFDKGELDPEREMHSLRLSAGEHTITIFLHRDEIEAFSHHADTEQTMAKIHHGIKRLHA